jgi:glyoxylase-like metal-dependent hydrolase (beta-lactamase superfamily II)
MPTSRRDVLTGLTGAAAAAFLPSPAAHAATEPHRLKVGSVELTVLSDGHLRVPVGFQLPNTAPEQVDALFRENQLDPPRQFAPATNVVLARTGDELVLIDAGAGSEFQDTAGKLAENLEAAGIDREAITKVVFTHGHADHLWGAIDEFDDSLHFPNATYVISPAEWDFWLSPDAHVRMPAFMQSMARRNARILKRIEPTLERRGANDTLASGLSFMPALGHTPGHMAILVDGGREQILIAGDALTHAQISFQRPDWHIASDADPDAAVQTRKRLLEQLAADRMQLIGFHLPWPGLGGVERDGTGHRFVPS